MARYEHVKRHEYKHKNPLFVDQMLQRYKLEKCSERLYVDTHRCMTKFISELNEHIVAIDGGDRFVGKVEEIVSAAEGVYTSNSDLDYLIVLENSHMWLTEPADIRRIIPITNKLLSVTHTGKKCTYPRANFEIILNNSSVDIGEKFMSCDECRKTATECTKTHQFRSLRAILVQEEYERLINELIGKGVLYNDITINDTRKHGPAVTLDITYKGFKVSVDVTIALKIPKTSPCWPFNDEDFRLRDDVREHVDVCHLVAAGDYWKLSFALAEREMMSEEDKKTLRVMKIIRNKEHAKITSYALKTTILKPTSQDSEKSSMADQISSTVVEMVGESTTTGQSSAFVEGVEVTPRDDSTYPEPWRILDHLHKLRSVCYREGVIHTLLWTLILGLVSSLFMGVLYMATLSQPGDCLVFSEVFSISATSEKWCLSISEIIENAPCYHLYDNQTMRDSVRNKFDMFTYGFPWDASNFNNLHDDGNLSVIASYCQENSTGIDCIFKCLRSKYLCDAERNISLCRRTYMLLHVVCTYLIIGLCIVGMARTRDKHSSNRATLYETYKGLHVWYTVLLSVANVWAVLTDISSLQTHPHPIYMVLLATCYIIGIYIPLTIVFVAALEGSSPSSILKNPIAILFYTVLLCFTLWHNISATLTSGNPDMKYTWSIVLNIYSLMCMYAVVPLYATFQLGVLDVCTDMTSFLIKLLVVFTVAIVTAPASVTIFWTSGSLLLFGCVHIVLSCVRGRERPKTYPHRTVQNQSYWCFQPIFANYMSLYCSVPNVMKFTLFADKKVNALLYVCDSVLTVILAISMMCLSIFVSGAMTYITFSIIIEGASELLPEIRTQCISSYLACPIIAFTYGVAIVMCAFPFVTFASCLIACICLSLWMCKERFAPLKSTYR